MLKSNITRCAHAARKGFVFSPLILLVLLVAPSLTAAIENQASAWGTITGQVLEGPTGVGIPLVEIQVWNEVGEYLDAVLTDMNGIYTVYDVPPGRYFAATIESGFTDTLFEGRPCPLGECDPTLGTPIEVNGGTATTEINFVLQH